MDTDRRQGSTLRFEPGEGLLVVGAKTAVLDLRSAPETVVGTYVELVVAQRAERPASHGDLRNRELVQLADLLELSSEDLDALIDQELDRLLGRVVVPGAAPARAWRRLAFAALLGTAGVGAAAWAINAAAADPASSSGTPTTTAPPTTAPPTTAPTTAPPVTATPTTIAAGEPTVEIVQLPDGTTATRTESAPVPPADGVDIGTAVVYERDEAPPTP